MNLLIYITKHTFCATSNYNHIFILKIIEAVFVTQKQHFVLCNVIITTSIFC